MESGSVGEDKAMLKDMLTRESVAAVFAMQTSADLDARQRTIADRDGVPDERLIPFIAIMPDHLSTEERKAWVREVAEGLQAVVDDAAKSIAVNRTLAMMRDLGLGDDGDGGTRND
jgi:hypothetical protein